MAIPVYCRHQLALFSAISQWNVGTKSLHFGINPNDNRLPNKF